MGQALRITPAGGSVPKLAARFLQPTQAQAAANCRLSSGFMEPMFDLAKITSPQRENIQAIHRLNDAWLTWDKPGVSVASGPIAGDTSLRAYYTGDGEPRVTNYALATNAEPYPDKFYVLGVSPPTAAPTVTPAGGTSGVNESRAYCYTFVTPWGEESAPSPASAVTIGQTDDVWTITAMQDAPLNSLPITGGASWANNIATVLMSDTRGLRKGEEISVTGVNPASFNVDKATILSVDSGSVSYALDSNPGAYVAGGGVNRIAPHNTTGMKVRLYRTVTDDTGNTVFRFIKEVDVGTASIIDDLGADTGEALPTEGWLMPPVDLHSIISLKNGMMAGLSGNLVCFCEPNKPYAWPLRYQYAINFAGVGLGAFGNTVVVPTEANPYVFSGSEPATMGYEPLKYPWPCKSARSITALGNGVGYATDFGYAVIAVDGPSIITEGLYTEQEWRKLNPETIVAQVYAGRLHLCFSTDGLSRRVLAIDKSAGIIQINVPATTIWHDDQAGLLYAVVDNKIVQVDGNPGVKMSADWFSKEFVFAAPVNLGVARVEAKFLMSQQEILDNQAASDAVEAANQALITASATKGSLNAISVGRLSVGGSLVENLPEVPWSSLLFALYIDGEVKYSRTITNDSPFRLPSGYKADNCAVRVSGNVQVKSIVVAETIKDLRAA